MERGNKDCQCFLEHNDPDEMCNLCREKHFDRIADHHEALSERAREEDILTSFVESHPDIFLAE